MEDRYLTMLLVLLLCAKNPLSTCVQLRNGWLCSSSSIWSQQKAVPRLSSSSLPIASAGIQEEKAGPQSGLWNHREGMIAGNQRWIQTQWYFTYLLYLYIETRIRKYHYIYHKFILFTYVCYIYIERDNCNSLYFDHTYILWMGYILQRISSVYFRTLSFVRTNFLSRVSPKTKQTHRDSISSS